MNKLKFLSTAVFFLLLVSASFAQTELETKTFFNDKVELKMPKEFEIMEEMILKSKYPLESRPNFVYTNLSGGINVGFRLTANRASQELIPLYVENSVAMFEKLYPTAEWKDSGVKEINGRKVGYFEVITPAIDTKIYNLIFFTDLDEKLLYCTFNCTERNMKEWEPVAKEILQSLRIK